MNHPRFVVLASDRLAIEGDPDSPDYAIMMKKIVCHPRYPVAVAINGYGTLEAGTFPNKTGEVTVTDIIKEEFSAIQSRGKARVGPLAGRLKTVLLPLVQNQLPYSVIENPGGIHKLRVCIAAYAKTATESVEVALGETVAMDELLIGTTSLWPTDSLRPFYETVYSRDGFNYAGSPHWTATQLAKHARETLKAGIEEEKRINGGRNLKVGGNVDVVIVDHDRARFV